MISVHESSIYSRDQQRSRNNATGGMCLVERGEGKIFENKLRMTLGYPP